MVLSPGHLPSIHKDKDLHWNWELSTGAGVCSRSHHLVSIGTTFLVPECGRNSLAPLSSEFRNRGVFLCSVWLEAVCAPEALGPLSSSPGRTLTPMAVLGSKPGIGRVKGN